MTRATEQQNFKLEAFEGPLDFLLYLVQKSEVDIYEIPIHQIMEQFQDRWADLNGEEIDLGAEFIGSAASLLYLKSKMLLPVHEQANAEEEESDPRFEIIHQLIDYCRFKEAAKDLTVREEVQSAYFPRGTDPNLTLPKTPMGIEHLSLQDLSSLFGQLLDKATIKKGLIQEEEWLVSDKIVYIQNFLKGQELVPFFQVFVEGMSREELIVLFLAVLELMKMGEISIVKNTVTNTVDILARQPE